MVINSFLCNVCNKLVSCGHQGEMFLITKSTQHQKSVAAVVNMRKLQALHIYTATKRKGKCSLVYNSTLLPYYVGYIIDIMFNLLILNYVRACK